MNDQISKSDIPLETVISQVEEWRSNNNKYYCSDDLWNNIIKLYPTYTCHQIAKTLKMAHKTVKSKLILAGFDFPLKHKTNNTNKKDNPFAQCAFPESMNPINEITNYPLVLDCIKKNGIILKLNGFTQQQLLPIISLVLNHQSCFI